MTEDADSVRSMTIIAWSGELDRIWPTLILSSTGGAYGMQVTVFFTFWGLFPLVRDDVKITGGDAMTKALSAMNRPGLGRMKLSKLNMAGAGPRMMRSLARGQKIAPPEELLDVCHDLGVRLWPCQMTMDLLGIRREQLVDGVGEPTGAASALSEMARSDIQLFI